RTGAVSGAEELTVGKAGGEAGRGGKAEEQAGHAAGGSRQPSAHRQHPPSLHQLAAQVPGSVEDPSWKRDASRRPRWCPRYGCNILYDMPTKRNKPSRSAAAPRRGRDALPIEERKSRLIQARVDDELDSAQRQEARKRRVSVSQLIRNVLEDTFNLVDNIVSSSAHLARTVRRDALQLVASARSVRERPSAPSGGTERNPTAKTATDRGRSEVDAWQEVVVNREVECSRCQLRMRKGRSAML